MAPRGMVMLTHQLGGFLGAWPGGKVFEATGCFTAVWRIGPPVTARKVAS